MDCRVLVEFDYSVSVHYCSYFGLEMWNSFMLLFFVVPAVSSVIIVVVALLIFVP
jgi:hypothetical protein